MKMKMKIKMIIKMNNSKIYFNNKISLKLQKIILNHKMKMISRLNFKKKIKMI